MNFCIPDQTGTSGPQVWDLLEIGDCQSLFGLGCERTNKTNITNI